MSALRFIQASANRVEVGTGLANIDIGTIIVVCRPTAYPAASFRFMFDSQGNLDLPTFRRFDTGGGGGTLGLRILVGRATVGAFAGALVANVPAAGANKINVWACTWNVSGAGVDSDQRLYGGDARVPLREVTTYEAGRTVGSGAVGTETGVATIGHGAASSTRGFPGDIVRMGIWSHRLQLAEMIDWQFNWRAHLSTAAAMWRFGLHGLWVLDESGKRNNGTIITAQPSGLIYPPDVSSRRRIRARVPTAGILRQMLQHSH